LVWANCADEFLEALAFGVEDALAERGQAVIAAAGVVKFGSGTFVGFLDQAGFDEALDGTVESSGPQTDFVVGAQEDVLHDAVAVLLAGGKGEHDVEPLGLEGKKGLWVGLGHIYIYIKAYLYLSIVLVEGGGMVEGWRNDR
jgi:hypothetical protein